MVESSEFLLVVMSVLVGLRRTNELSSLSLETSAAYKTVLITLILLVSAILGSFTVAFILHEPVPRIHDEFSYVLMGDTFGSGHLANTAPAHPEFFDTFHVLMYPTYASKYFPAQGVFLAIGQKLTGHPAVGLWLSSGLACAVVYWMLIVWVGPKWALLGSVMFTFQYGIYSYWSQTYWGGMAAALGGALFFGAARRLWDQGDDWKIAALMSLGATMLVNSRPLEGVLAMLPMTIALVCRTIREKRGSRAHAWGGFILPASIVLILGAALTCIYNHAITGSYFRTPYMLHEQQYQESPFLSFLPLRPKLTYSSPWVQYYYEVREMMLYKLPRDPKTLVSVIARRFATWWSFYCGVLLTPALLFPILLRRGKIRWWQIGVLAGLIIAFATSGPMDTGWRLLIDILVLVQVALLWIVFDGFWPRLALLTCCILMLEGLVVKLFFAHYFAPAACLVMFLQVDGLRRIWNWKHYASEENNTRQARRHAARTQTAKAAYPLRGFVYLLPVACLLSLVVRVEARINGWSEDPHGPDRKALLMHDWSLQRDDIQRWLEKQSGTQLVFVRYSAHHNVIFEWVYNRADIMHAKVVWARDLGAEHNKLLLREMPDRTVWALEADARDPRLIPYADAPVSVPAPAIPASTVDERLDQ